MAWPGNNFNNFWEAMYSPPPPPPGPRGAGVDHAPPPPPPELPSFMNPDFWNRWSQGHGWEDFTGPHEGPRGSGPHGRHAHAHGYGHGRRHGGRRGGRGSGEDGPANDGSDNEAFPPEYITDDEVAAATAAAEGEKKKDASPDTTMRDETEDPPEEVPNPDEGDEPRRRGGRCGGGRRGRGGPGRDGLGGRRGGPRGMHHHGGPPPFGPFGAFGPMFGGGMFGGGPRRRSWGQRGPHGHGGPHGSPPFPSTFEPFSGGTRGPHGHRHRGPPPPPGSEGPFDFRGMMSALANHPYAHHIREFLERAQQQQQQNDGNHGERVMTPEGSDDGMEASFTPPLDVFEQADGWVLHLAVPGAKKEDVGVNYDADRSILSVGGVIHRPGDEDFLKSLISGERSVGLFSREVRLPPVEGSSSNNKEEVNSEGIAAKMEDGILVITVPKVEKDWTEVKRVEVE